MRFAWDASKSAANYAIRGFDFAFATQVFDGPTLVRSDTRRDYGEVRLVAIGLADGVMLTVVYTDRFQGSDLIRRVISARRSNRHERQAFEQHQ